MCTTSELAVEATKFLCFDELRHYYCATYCHAFCPFTALVKKAKVAHNRLPSLGTRS